MAQNMKTSGHQRRQGRTKESGDSSSTYPFTSPPRLWRRHVRIALWKSRGGIAACASFRWGPENLVTASARGSSYWNFYQSILWRVTC